MIPLEEARQFVLSQIRPLPPVTVALDEALGCVAAGPVVAGGPIPEFANSQMDGYAVRSADAVAGCRLRVVGTVVAG